MGNIPENEVPLQRYNRHAKLVREEYKAAGLYDDIKNDRELFKNLVRESIEAEVKELAGESKPESAPEAKKAGETESEPEQKESPPEPAVSSPKKKASTESKDKPPAKKAKAKTAKRKLSKRLQSLGVVGEERLYLVPVNKINLPEYQPRFDRGSLALLEKSIEHGHGIRDVVTVYEDEQGKLVAVNKHRAIKAAKNVLRKNTVKLDTVKVLLVDGTEHDNDIFITKVAISEASAKPLNPLEWAGCFYKLLGSGYSAVSIASLAGVSNKFVKDKLALVGISAGVRKLLLRGKLTEDRARSIAKEAKDLAEQDTMARRFLSDDGFSGEESAVKMRKIKRASLNESVEDDGKLLSPARTRNLLSKLASAYNSFVRGGEIVNSSNEDWQHLTALLSKVRKFKVAGKLPV